MASRNHGRQANRLEEPRSGRPILVQMPGPVQPFGDWLGPGDLAPAGLGPVVRRIRRVAGDAGLVGQ